MKHKKENVIIRKIGNIIYILIFCFLITILIYKVIDEINYKITIDEKLIKSYDLTKDLIPPPVQKTIKREQITTKVGDVTVFIDKLATYDITGKVEATKDFGTSKLASMLSFQKENSYAIDYISPRDLTLSWGEIALNKNSGHIYCDQYESTNNNYRMVWLRYDSFLLQKYTAEGIQKNVSNNHIIALDNRLRTTLSKIKNGDIVRIIGYLVEVNTSGGAKWGPSSMIRTDNGCEIILAEKIIVMP